MELKLEMLKCGRMFFRKGYFTILQLSKISHGAKEDFFSAKFYLLLVLSKFQNFPTYFPT